MKKTIAVFFGGTSPEHDISVITALSSVIKPLQLTNKYNVLPVYIAKTGAWYADTKFADISIYSQGLVEEICKKLKPVTLSFDGGLTFEKQGIRGKKIAIDIAFPAMHGGNGEDGSLMGLLRMANIPFVGSDMEASVIAMDKVLAKQVAEAHSVPVSKYISINSASFTKDPDEVTRQINDLLHYPLFVKPAHLGSSIGITRVDTLKALVNALEVAAYYDDKIIVEEAVQNLIEVTVPIIGNEVPKPALVERPLAVEGDFFDFDTKYMNGGKKSGGAKQTGAQGYSELPANLPSSMYDKAVATALSMYEAAGCEGISRIDLLIDSKGETVYFNEINPLPGSLYAHNWRKAGVSSIDLVEKLVSYAEQRHAKKQKLEKTFSTSFLKQF